MPRKTRSTRRSNRHAGGFLDFLFGSSEEKKEETMIPNNSSMVPVQMDVNTVQPSANVQASVGGKRKSRKARKASRKSRKARKARKGSRRH